MAHLQEFAMGGFADETAMWIGLVANLAKQNRQLCNEVMKREQFALRVYEYRTPTPENAEALKRAVESQSGRMNILVPTRIETNQDLIEVVETLNRYREGLLAKEYEVNSPALVELLDAARDALARRGSSRIKRECHCCPNFFEVEADDPCVVCETCRATPERPFS